MPKGISYCWSRLSVMERSARSGERPVSRLSPPTMSTVSASPPWIAAAATLNMVAAVAPETCKVFENVGCMPRYSLMATLKRWNGEAKAWLESTPSMSVFWRPASARAL